ncbi:MAG TPA: hypothetical protein VGU65_13145 [Frateuria sp.]|uniref:hypothetical protein n=1 Tax=Frateuria sp. TaxID=2211372 RepID=UPI002DF26983|nr:hypothetical protein [Frateuria sp.]
MMRSWLFRWYGWVAAIAAAVVLTCALRSDAWLSVLAPAAAAILGFCYFVQQQKLAETTLFERLFSSFNRRYDDLNGKLADIADQQDTSAGARKVVVDYFNLCAEEYLFYKQGYIHPDVWTAWCRGMLWYLRRHPFKEVWNKEVETESFYGLTIEKIQQGAMHHENTP